MTRLECSALRGMAIVSIMLHNFAHWLPGAVPENEFSFNLEHYEYFWESVLSKDFFIQILSFWGHLGVPVFVFMTGYGLAQKYDHQKDIDKNSFLLNHWKKLFVPLVVGTFVYVLTMFVIEGHLVCSVPRIIVQLTMLLNFISPMHLLPMPYWYLGMTMQLYIIYLLFVYRRPLTILLIVTIVSLIAMASLVYIPKAVVLSKFNFVGWLAPFFMGIVYSRYQTIVQFGRGWRSFGILAVSLFLVLIFGFNFFTWLLIPIFIVVLAVSSVKYIPISIQQNLDPIGRISLYLLIVHPITRELIMLLVSICGGYISILIYVIVSFFVVYLFKYIKRLFSWLEW